MTRVHGVSSECGDVTPGKTRRSHDGVGWTGTPARRLTRELSARARLVVSPAAAPGSPAASGSTSGETSPFPSGIDPGEGALWRTERTGRSPGDFRNGLLALFPEKSRKSHVSGSRRARCGDLTGSRARRSFLRQPGLPILRRLRRSSRCSGPHSSWERGPTSRKKDVGKLAMAGARNLARPSAQAREHAGGPRR